MRGPIGQIERESLDGRTRALATAQEDRVGNVGAQRVRGTVEMTGAEQVGDVRNDPVVAGVDEEIAVQRLNVRVHRRQRVFDDRQERLQLAGRRLS